MNLNNCVNLSLTVVVSLANDLIIFLLFLLKCGKYHFTLICSFIWCDHVVNCSYIHSLFLWTYCFFKFVVHIAVAGMCNDYGCYETCCHHAKANFTTCMCFGVYIIDGVCI